MVRSTKWTQISNLTRYAMRASIVIAAHNEGERLWKTVRSCLETSRGLGPEIIVVDDASTDGSLREVLRRFRGIRHVRLRRRRGPGGARAVGARKARGDVLVFLDGHSKPAYLAIERLVRGVERLAGQIVLVPCLVALDPVSWTYDWNSVGHCYELRLEDFFAGWVKPEDLPGLAAGGPYLDSPALTSGCLAISRKLYRIVRGFDSGMIDWGVEDLDLGLKIRLMGYDIRNDRGAVVGHYFRPGFLNYSVATGAVLANQMRAARKNFGDAVWDEWKLRARDRCAAGTWSAAWSKFEAGRSSLERERRYLHSRRRYDEFWYAEKFGLDWPRRNSRSSGADGSAASAADSTGSDGEPCRTPNRRRDV